MWSEWDAAVHPPMAGAPATVQERFQNYQSVAMCTHARLPQQEKGPSEQDIELQEGRVAQPRPCSDLG